MGRTVTCTTAVGTPGDMQCEIKNEGNLATSGFVAFLFAIFCAYWAMQHGRNAWVWFFFGLVLAPVAGLSLLYATATERARARARVRHAEASHP